MSARSLLALADGGQLLVDQLHAHADVFNQLRVGGLALRIGFVRTNSHLSHLGEITDDLGGIAAADLILRGAGP